jgi:ribosomal protein S17
MIFNRKERTQLLEGLVVSDEDAAVVVRSYRQVHDVNTYASLRCMIHDIHAENFRYLILNKYVASLSACLVDRVNRETAPAEL